MRVSEALAEPRAAEQHGSAGASSSLDVPQQFASGTLPAIDWTVAKQYFGDGPEVLLEFSELMKAQSPLLLADIRCSIETLDSKLLQRAAHTMEGSVTYFGAQPLAAAAALENPGRIGSFEGDPQMLAIFEQELSRVMSGHQCQNPDRRFRVGILNGKPRWQGKRPLRSNRFYSWRKASIGSMRAAARAG